MALHGTATVNRSGLSASGVDIGDLVDRLGGPAQLGFTNGDDGRSSDEGVAWAMNEPRPVPQPGIGRGARSDYGLCGVHMRKIVILPGAVVALFLILRALAEPFVIDIHDPGTYHNDWGRT